MDQYKTLEYIPAEIQCMILTHLPSVHTLYSMIRASPRLYQVFLANRDKVLLAVACKAIPHNLLRDVVAAFRASHCFPKGSRPHYNEVLAFMQEYTASVKPDNESSCLFLDPSWAVALCRLQRTVNALVQDLCQRQIPALMAFQWSDNDPPRRPMSQAQNEPTHQTPLSTIEEIRLQRAFYRLETYACLFQNSGTAPGKFSGQEQAQLFLAKFPLWQVEEIACVRHHLNTRLGEAFDRLEDDFVAIELDGEAEVLDRRNVDYIPLPFVPGEANAKILDRWETEDYFFSFEGKGRVHLRVVEFILSLGLGFVREVLLHPECQCLEKLVHHRARHHNQWYFHGDYLSAALCISPAAYAAPAVPATGSLQATAENGFQGDHVDEPNQAWSHEPAFSHLLSPESEPFDGLRAWGHIFWDSSRLKQAGILIEE